MRSVFLFIVFTKSDWAKSALALAANIGNQVEAKANHRLDLRKPQQV